MTYHNPTHTPACPSQTAHHRGSGGNYTHSILLKSAAAVLLLLLFCGVFCGVAAAVAVNFDPGADNDYISAKQLVDDLNSAAELIESNTIKLLNDVTITENHINFKNAGDIYLDLNGHVLNRSNTARPGQSVIEIWGNTHLTLIDSNPNAVHNFSVGDDGLWTLSPNGNKTVYGGVITGGSGGEGGGILIVDYNSNLTMNGGNIVGNKAKSCGGGVSVFYSSVLPESFTMTNGTIQGNIAGTSGGGVNMIHSLDKFNMSGGLIANNIAGTSGGGVYAAGELTISDTAEIKNNTASGNGGGIFIATKSGYPVTINGGSITDNKAVTGGGIFTYRSLTLENSKITGNKAIGTDDNGAGGGIFCWAAELTINRGVEISNNTAKGNGGGGIGIESAGASLKMTDGCITNNTAEPLSTNPANDVGTGGGVRVANGASFDLSGGNISANEAVYGGGIFIAAKSGNKVTITGGSISDNKAVTGGGIFTYHSLTLENSKITGNKAIGTGDNGAGGGIFCWAAELTINEGVEISNNTAKGNGGGGIGIESAGAVLTMRDGCITNNTAEPLSTNPANDVGTGGGVRVANGASFDLSGGNISANEAVYGGGIFIAAKSGNKVTITGGSISDNKAVTGGGIFTYHSLTLENSKITGNKAIGTGDDGAGGGIFCWAAELTINEGVEISNNTAKGNGGGGIGIESAGAVLTMRDGCITNNTAEPLSTNSANDVGTGGGVRVANGASFDLSGGNITGNTVKHNGGGIAVLTGAKLKVNGSPVVKDNLNGSSALNNIWAASKECIILTGKLTNAVLFVNNENTVTGFVFATVDENYDSVANDDAAQFKFDGDKSSGELSGNELKWKERHTVTFDKNGHAVKEEVPSQNIHDGGYATKPETICDKTGYTYEWYNETACTNAWDFDNDTVTKDTTLYAKWTVNTSSETASEGTVEFNADKGDVAVKEGSNEKVTSLHLDSVSGVTGDVTFTADNTSAGKPPAETGKDSIVISVFSINATVTPGTKASFNVTVELVNPNDKKNVVFWHYKDENKVWEKLTSSIVAENGNIITYKVETDSFSPFATTIQTEKQQPTPAPQPSHSSSSSSFSYEETHSVWMQPAAEPAATMTPAPTQAAEVVPGVPVASPINQPPQQTSTPAPAAGILAGLGAALVFGLRRK